MTPPDSYIKPQPDPNLPLSIMMCKHVLALIEMTSTSQVTEYLDHLSAEIRGSLIRQPALFDLAVITGHSHVLEVLVKLGADIRRRVNGQPVLMGVSSSYAQNVSLKCMRLLIDAKADVNEFSVPDRLTSINTPLQIAVRFHEHTKCMLLMQNGADPFLCHANTPYSAKYICSQYPPQYIDEKDRKIWWAVHSPYFMAFAMGSHHRLGSNSGVFLLDKAVLCLIMQFFHEFQSF